VSWGDSIKRWSEKCGEVTGEYKFEGEYSGIYQCDEQKVMINGKGKWRYVIFPTTNQGRFRYTSYASNSRTWVSNGGR
jgi:hypothetical protein